MITSTINLTIFIIMIIVYLNEMRNISMFLLNFNYIKDLSKIIMELKCNNIYCEAETDRYNIAKNSYNLLLPNDIFNSKTYIIYTFIISIFLFIYYYYILFDKILDLQNNFVNLIHLLLLTILLVIIILRYVPHDSAGYSNFFKYIDKSAYFRTFIVISFCLLAIAIFLLRKNKKDNNSYFILLCFMLSFIILLNLLSIVLSFKNNTKPILKTKELLFSLNNSLKYEIAEYNDKLTIFLKDPPNETIDLEAIKLDIVKLSTNIDNGTYKKITKDNIEYLINILNIFSELSKIKFNKQNFNDINKIYKDKLLSNFADNLSEFIKTNSSDNYMQSEISELSLIFDAKVKLPVNYDEIDHMTNENSYNDDYIYTADISYNNPNLFYEKYWGISEKYINGMYGLPQFLWDYVYFTPKILFGGYYNPNIFKILILVILFIFIVSIIFWKILPIDGGIFSIYDILQPLITFVILIIYILIFICFNTWFNKYVVYKCLDSSYKRSLNKLNNIVTPYIRLYDNKIIKGNKNYIQHYIISNVFNSILCGYIKLNDDKSINVYAMEALDASKNLVDVVNKVFDYINIDIVNINKVTLLKNISDANIAVDNAILKTDKAYTSFSNASIACNEVKTELSNISTELAKITTAQLVPSIIVTARKFAKNAKSKALNALKISENANILAKANSTASKPINESKDNAKYYDINKIKSSRLNFANMNHNILNNDNEFREYYKERFSNIYDKVYNNDNATALYNIFTHIFLSRQIDITEQEHIEKYFQDIITKDNVKKIFSIIRKCFDLFEENKFNNNLVYYNNRDNKHKEINIDIYKKFKFYKYNNKIIPYKFILKLTTYKEVEEFIKTSDDDDKKYTDKIESIFPNILTDNIEDNLQIQESEIEKKRDNNLIKIIAKYLLILGHINYNRIEYNNEKDEEKRKIIYEKKTYNLYKLISNTLYKDTYDDINDTFKTSTTQTLIIDDEKYSDYKNLTYIYNYLEAKYINISSNNNNYLENIIKSINNKINDDNKIFNNENKSAQYIFRDSIDKIDTPDPCDDEEEILNIANNISTFDFGSTYIFNMLILILYYYLIIKKNNT